MSSINERSQRSGRRRGREHEVRSQEFYDAEADERWEEPVQWHGRRARALPPSYRRSDIGREVPPAGPDLNGAWEVIRNRRNLVLGVAAIVFTAVALGTLLQEPTYRATGTIEFRKQGGDVVPLEALFDLARIPDQDLQTQYTLLRSPALARRVVSELQLAGSDEFRRQPAPVQAGIGGGRAATPDQAGIGGDRAATPERLIDAFGKRLRIDPVEDSRMVRVSFEAGDPELAARVVNSVISNYTAMRVESARGAVDRLSTQVDSVRTRLAASEEKLQAYVVANGLQMVETGNGDTESIVQARLRQLQQQLTEAEADRYEVEGRYNIVQQRNYDALASDVLRSLTLRIAETEAEYAKLRATFTDAYPRTQTVKRQLDALNRQLRNERARIAREVRGEYEGAVKRQQLLQQALAEQSGMADRLAARTSEYRILKREVDAQQQLYSVLQQKVKEAGVGMALAPSEISVVDAAMAPEDPFRPDPWRSLPLGLMVGLLLGVGLAFVREHTDPNVRTIEEIDAFGAAPILGMIPGHHAATRSPLQRLAAPLGGILPASANGGLPPAQASAAPAEGSWVLIDQQEEPDSPLAEAFSSLRTSVLLQSDGPLPRSLLVTSSQPGEGKTTVSINLALSMARLGRRVLLIDADIRRPSVHRALSLSGRPGLAEYLTRTGDWDWRQLVRVQSATGLDVLTGGIPPEHPSELLSSDRMCELLAQAQDEYDVVVIDSPALLVNVPDARILAPLSEGVVLVVRSGVTPRALLRRVLQQAPNLIGVVLNDLDLHRLPSYYGRYATDETAEETARS